MWRLLLTLCVVLAATTVDAETAASEPAGQLPEPIPTRQAIFSIPFQIDKATDPAQEPVEVQLYMSTDRGVSWRPCAKVAPSQGYFLFRAIGDGQYWFLVRTMDRSGQLKPQGPPRPELRVLVDTTPPTLQLEATRGDAGQILTQWKIGELAPNRESLKIQYRSDTDPTWQPVAVDWQNVKVEGPMQTGKVVWWPPAGIHRLEIRAEVSDLAGNAAVSHQQVNFDAGDQGPSGPELKDPVNATAQRWRPAKLSQPDARWTASTPPATEPTKTPSSEPAGADAIAGRQPDAAKVAAKSPKPSVSAYPKTQTPDADPSAFSGPPNGSVAGSVNPPIRNRYVSPDVPQAPARPWPAGVRPRMVNSRVFELEYAPLAPGAPSPGVVQLWGTRDGGRTWESYGQDADGRSPVLVTLMEEGAYGFRVAAQANPQMRPVPPAAGQQPDIWVWLDLSRPTCRIVSAEPSPAPNVRALAIRWEASDRMLAERPVSLFYKDASGGGWSTIAAGLDNQGMFTWKIGPATPQRVYLRMEVRDAAGNLAVFETPQSVSTVAQP